MVFDNFFSSCASPKWEEKQVVEGAAPGDVSIKVKLCWDINQSFKLSFVQVGIAKTENPFLHFFVFYSYILFDGKYLVILFIFN